MATRNLLRIGVGLILLGIFCFCAAFLTGCGPHVPDTFENGKYRITVTKGNTYDTYETDSLLQVENCVRFNSKGSNEPFEVCGSYTIEYLKP